MGEGKNGLLGVSSRKNTHSKASRTVKIYIFNDICLFCVLSSVDIYGLLATSLLDTGTPIKYMHKAYSGYNYIYIHIITYPYIIPCFGDQLKFTHLTQKTILQSGRCLRGGARSDLQPSF